MLKRKLVWKNKDFTVLAVNKISSYQYVFKLSKKYVRRSVTRNILKRYIRNNISVKTDRTLVFIANTKCSDCAITLKLSLKKFKKYIDCKYTFDDI